jgi:hypothetical protein
MAARVLSPNSPILPNTSLLIGLLPLTFGTLSILNPSIAMNGWKFPASTDPTAQKTMIDLIRLWASREAFMGGSIVLAWWFGQRRILGALTLMGVPVVVLDGLVQRNVTGSGGEWFHWPFVPVMLGVGAGLVGWF